MGQIAFQFILSPKSAL